VFPVEFYIESSTWESGEHNDQSVWGPCLIIRPVRTLFKYMAVIKHRN